MQELLDHLQQRGEEYAADAEKKLAERAEAEAKAMVEILERQQKHITKTRAAAEKPQPDWRQLRIRFDGDELEDEAEKRQLDANKRYWAKRLDQLKDELRTEPDRIREVYSVKAKRIEPVGLVYLWPVTG